MLSTAAILSFALQCAPTVHPDTILDIARIESGLNPYAIAEIIRLKGRGTRVISHMPSSKTEALKILEDIKEKKHRFSVGVMQITNTNFKGFKVDSSMMLEPCQNLAVAEKIIVDCFKRGGTLKRALSCYYSGNFETGQRAEPSFRNSSYVERIGYIVPSTRDDKARSQAPSHPSDAAIVYPDGVIRGNFTPLLEEKTPIYPRQIIRGEIISTDIKENKQ